MASVDDFFFAKNTLENLSSKDIKQTENYLDLVNAFARTTYQSIYVIDYYKKGFEYVSGNPLFLCGYTAEEVKKMGYDFYFKQVIQPDVNLLLKINTVGFDFYERIPLNERKLYTITYDFHIKNQNGKVILINQKLTPIFITNEGKLWKSICIVSISNEQNSGNIKIYKSGDNKVFAYCLNRDLWKVSEKVRLSDREKEILQLSIKGYTINEIADAIFVCPDTIKFHRKKLFYKLGVTNISEAISYAIDNCLIF